MFIQTQASYIPIISNLIAHREIPKITKSAPEIRSAFWGRILAINSIVNVHLY
jgi:hypothetical protein